MTNPAIKLAEEAVKLAQDALNMAKGTLLPTDINVVIDRSGSMSTIQVDTVGGFNRFLKDQQALADPATISLYQFDHEYQIVYEGRNIKDAPELSLKTYLPRGSTALLDAIGRTVNAVSARNPPRPVVVIITDGHENCSREFTNEQIKELIKSKEAAGWQFVYLGANQDAFSVGHAMGFSAGSTMSVAANAVGTQSMYESVSAATARYRAGGATGQSVNFTEEDRKAQEDAGAVKSS